MINIIYYSSEANQVLYNYEKFILENIIYLLPEQLGRLSCALQEVCKEWSGRRRARREVSTSKEDWRPAACWPCIQTELYTSRRDRTLVMNYFTLTSVNIWHNKLFQYCSRYYLLSSWRKDLGIQFSSINLTSATGSSKFMVKVSIYILLKLHPIMIRTIIIKFFIN